MAPCFVKKAIALRLLWNIISNLSESFQIWFFQLLEQFPCQMLLSHWGRLKHGGDAVSLVVSHPEIQMAKRTKVWPWTHFVYFNKKLFTWIDGGKVIGSWWGHFLSCCHFLNWRQRHCQVWTPFWKNSSKKFCPDLNVHIEMTKTRPDWMIQTARIPFSPAF